MGEPTLERRLRDEPVPDADGAEERAWAVVRAAYAERAPVPARSPVRRFAAAALAAVVVAAVALTPAGAEVVDVVRDVVGIDESETKPALGSLPAAGELLVDSEAGPWIVREDGSKRLLGDYGEATWSPRGLFVMATDGRQLVALDPAGAVRWTVTAPGEVRDPRWSPSGFRIAYRSAGGLRVVAGDGTGDEAVARNVAPVAPAWRPVVGAKLEASGAPGTEQVSYVGANGDAHLIDADSGAPIRDPIAKADVPPHDGPVREIEWSANGRVFLSLTDRELRTARGPVVSGRVTGKRTSLREAAIAPDGSRVAVLQLQGGQTEIRLVRIEGGSDRVFSGPGAIEDLAWSPDGRWLLAGWRDADQWLFIRADRPRRLVAFDEISEQFDPGNSGGAGFPRVEGWVLPER